MSEIQMVKGEELNKTLLDVIRQRREAMLTDGKMAIENNLNTQLYDIDKAEGKAIILSDKEEYDCLYELETLFLKFGSKENSEDDSWNKEEVYDIPGVKVKIGDQEKEVYLNVRKDKIRDLAKKAKDYERILGHSISIKFPNQVYQFNHDASKIPGETYSAPRPKLASETNKQYEEYLENLYKLQGVTPTKTEDGIWRKPYPHELIDYKGDKPERKEENQSEYYSFNFAAKKKAYDAKKAKPGEKTKVTKAKAFADSKLSEKIKYLFGGIKDSLGDENKRKKLKYALITAGAAGIGIYAAVSTGIIPFAFPAAVPFIYVWAKKRQDKKRQKEEEEKKKPKPPTSDTPTPTPDNPAGPGSGGGSGDGAPTPGAPGAPSGGTDSDEDIFILGENLDENLQSLRENGRQIKNIEDQITYAETGLADLDPSAADYAERKAEYEQRLTALKQQKREMLENLHQDVQNILDSYRLGNESGGPKL